MRMAGRWPPPRLTRPTPGASESFAARRVSTRSSTLVSGRVGELTARERMGASAGLTLLYTGGIGRSVGRKEAAIRSEEHTSELQSQSNLVCRLLLEKKKKKKNKS